MAGNEAVDSPSAEVFKALGDPIRWSILAQIAAGTLPVERIVTSRIGVSDVVEHGIDRLADPEGDQVKILVAPGAVGPA